WYENDGQGGFESSHFIASSIDGVNSIYTADMDGDGDPDVIVSSNYDNALAWVENTDGQGDFGAPHMIDHSGGTNSVYAADIDGDGDMDLVTSYTTYASNIHKINWYENTDGQGDFSEVKTIANDVGGGSIVVSADIDGDGDQDVVVTTAAANKIVWYENTDGLGSFAQHMIDADTYGEKSLYVADLDNDGDMDVVAASDDGNNLVWYENTDGLGNFGQQQIISHNTNGENPYFPKTLVYAADIDNDGDLDVVASSSIHDKITW